MRINHTKTEKKWREKWDKTKIYEPNLRTSKKPFYNLMMFPYPSAEGLHVGNMYAFTGADVFGRYKRMCGYDVFEPIGLDGFGIHSENYAIKVGRHPKEHAEISQKNFYNQLSRIGNGFTWSHRLETYDPDYYKWTQWLFIQMFKKGLAYRGTAKVNWCPSCKTVLADEQVEKNKCERCKHEVERREMTSWYFKITDYAEKLLANIDKIDWPNKIKNAQTNWIGKKEGINITYKIKGSGQTVTCFTTRPDTNFGATFIVVAPEHELARSTKNKKVSRYIKTSLKKSDQQRMEEGKKKTGIFTGLYAINPLNGYEMPVWVSDFVLGDYGTGAVVGVPGHDERDFEFAKEFDLEVKNVIADDKMVNSDFLNGLSSPDAIKMISNHIENEGYGERTVSFHLRDWLISRQRYWGPPIPMVHCKDCGELPVPENELPVVLPAIKDFKPKGDGTSPLSNAPDSWKFTKCPKCGKKAERDTDVSDTFLDSSWYFLAYPNLGTEEYKNGLSLKSKQSKKESATPLNPEITAKWLPVNTYIGGAEHAVLHLLYARFVTMALHDMKIVNFDEPFPYLFGHGLIIKNGSKMSKSRGNVIVPDEYIDKFGADVFRLYLMFLGPYSDGGDFKDTGIEGMNRFLGRVADLYKNRRDINPSAKDKVNIKLHQTIKKVTHDVSKLKYNTAISAIMELVNLVRDSSSDSRSSLARTGVATREAAASRSSGSQKVLESLCLMIAPFAPFLAEELWVEVLGNKFSVHQAKWPEFDDKLTKADIVNIPVQVDGKHRGTIEMAVGASQADVTKKALEIKAVGDRLEKNYKIIFVKDNIINFVNK